MPEDGYYWCFDKTLKRSEIFIVLIANGFAEFFGSHYVEPIDEEFKNRYKLLGKVQNFIGADYALDN